MFCVKCGFDNMPGARFCEKCGAPLHAEAPASGLKGSLAGGTYVPPARGASANGFDYGTERATNAGFAPAASLVPTGAAPAPTYAPPAPAYVPEPSAYAPVSPAYVPEAPAYAPANPAYAPELPVYNSELSAPASEPGAFSGEYENKASFGYEPAPAEPDASSYTAPAYTAPAYSAPAYTPPAAPATPGYYGYGATAEKAGSPFPFVTLIGGIVAIVALFLELLKYTNLSLFKVTTEIAPKLKYASHLGELGTMIIVVFIICVLCIVCPLAVTLCSCLKKKCRAYAILGMLLFIGLFVALFLVGADMMGLSSFSSDMFDGLFKAFGLGFWMYVGGMLVAAVGGGKH